jgi:hypothetical protein
MTVIRRSRLWRTLCWLLVAAFVGTLMPVVVEPARAQTPAARTILVLPVVDQSGYGEARLGRWVSDEVVLAVTGKPGLAGSEFVSTSPVVRRALAEGRLLPAQIETPPETPAAAVAIGHALQVDAVLQVTIESLVMTEYPKQAKVSLSGELYAVAANYNQQTGEAAATPTAERTFKVVGASHPVTQYNGADQPLVREAIRGAVTQVAAAVAGEEPGRVAPPSPKHNTAWIGVILVVGLLALLVSSTKNESHAPAGAFAPVPVSLSVQAGGIQLTWQAPPPGGLTLLKYEVQRSVDGQPYQSVDNGLVGAADFRFFDPLTGVSTTETHLLRYRIAAIYTNQAVSSFANFAQVSFPH